MVLLIKSALCVDVILKLKMLKHFLLRCDFYSTQRWELSNNIIKVDLCFIQLNTKDQVNILLYDYPPNKSITLNQDIIMFVINFLKKYGLFDKPLISFN